MGTKATSTSVVKMILLWGPPLSQHHASLCTYFGAIFSKYDFGKYKIFLRPDEAILDLAWSKLVYANKITFFTAIQIDV